MKSDSTTRHSELLEQAARWASKNHAHFLAEALVCVKRDPGDPLEALALLTAMQGTDFAGRENERAALADVGRWLEQRLKAEPAIDGQALAVELGWLRRLVVYQERVGQTAATAHRPGRGRGGAGRFGGSLEVIRQRRRSLLPSVVKTGVEIPGGGSTKVDDGSPEPAPVEVPERFLVFCPHAQAARGIWQTARGRIKKGKAAKDKPFAVTASEAPMPPGVVVEVSFATTEGLAEVFRGFDDAGGRFGPFWVVEWIRDGAVVRARTVAPT